MRCYRLAGKSVVDKAREIQRDRHPRSADVARRQPGDLVEPVDDRVAVDRQPLRRRHEVEATFAPGDERCFSAEKSFSRDSRSSCDRVKRIRAAVLAESSSWRPRMREISPDLDACALPGKPQCILRVSAGSRQSGYTRAAFADADVHDDAVAFTQKRGGPTSALPHGAAIDDPGRTTADRP